MLVLIIRLVSVTGMGFRLDLMWVLSRVGMGLWDISLGQHVCE